MGYLRKKQEKIRYAKKLKQVSGWSQSGYYYDDSRGRIVRARGFSHKSDTLKVFVNKRNRSVRKNKELANGAYFKKVHRIAKWDLV